MMYLALSYIITSNVTKKNFNLNLILTCNIPYVPFRERPKLLKMCDRRGADGKHNKFCYSVILLSNEILMRCFSAKPHLVGVNTSACWSITAPASCKVLSASGTFLILRNYPIRKGQIVFLTRYQGAKRRSNRHLFKPPLGQQIHVNQYTLL